MSFFSDLRAERLIAEIRGIGDPLHPDSQKAFQKLAKIGAGAIPKILDALAVADKKETAVVRRHPRAADRQQDLSDPGRRAGRGQPAHRRRRELGADHAARNYSPAC